MKSLNEQQSWKLTRSCHDLKPNLLQVLICLNAIQEIRVNGKLGKFAPLEGYSGPINAELNWIEELRIQLPLLESVRELMDY